MLRMPGRGPRAWVLAGSAAVALSCGGIAAAGASAACPNEQVRSETGSAHLPDCRAYERVSPAYKDGGHLDGLGGDAASFLVESLGAFAETESDQYRGGSSQGAAYDLVRFPTGWSAMALDPTAAQFARVRFLDARSDYGASLWELDPGDGIARLYARRAGTFVPVGPETPTAPAEEATQYVGASRDLGHAYFSVNTFVLWPGDTTLPGPGTTSLYEYTGTGNSEPKLVAVENEGALASNLEAHLIGQCGSDLGGKSSGTRYNAVSADGRTAYFTVVQGGCTETVAGKVLTGTGPPVNEVYARLNAATTVSISQPSKEACEACDTTTGLQSARYEGASEDGSKGFFTTGQSLLPGTAGRNLYQYDFNKSTGPGHPNGRVVLASAGDATVSTPTANVQGVVRISEDGSHVYFVATGALTHKPNSSGASAHEGADNLYLFERDAAFPQGRTAFIGVVARSQAECEEEEELGLEEVCAADKRLWSEGDQERPAASTPDGRYLVFVTSVDLTPDDTSRVGQLFRYDAQTGALARISVPSSPVESEDGNTSLESDVPGIVAPSFNITSSARGGANALTMSANGAYVFFQSAKRLAPSAVEGDVNVYEYHEGSLSLITDGHDGARYREEPVVSLLGTDESGSDVFFKTADPLVGQDTDTNADVYDARIGGGFPAPAIAAE
jgi:hypothetical protein